MGLSLAHFLLQLPWRGRHHGSSPLRDKNTGVSRGKGRVHGHTDHSRQGRDADPDSGPRAPKPRREGWE